MSRSVKTTLSVDHDELDHLLADARRSVSLGQTVMLRCVDLFWARLAVHIRAENVRLFPSLIEQRPEIAETIANLRDDHNYFMRSLSEMMKELRRPGQADLSEIDAMLLKLRDRLSGHNELEERLIYPMADQMSDPLPEEVRAELENLPQRIQ